MTTQFKRKVLAIDGGGIRGIIPAMVLHYIEEKTGKAIALYPIAIDISPTLIDDGLLGRNIIEAVEIAQLHAATIAPATIHITYVVIVSYVI